MRTDATLFWIDFDNQIEVDPNNHDNHINVGATRHRGVEVSLFYDMASLSPAMEGVSVFGTYAYTQAKLNAGENAGNDLRLYSRHTGTVGTRYEIDNWLLSVTGYAQSKQYADEANTRDESVDGKIGIIPSFATLDTKVSKDFNMDGRDMQVSFGVKNLLDRRYFVRAREKSGGLFVGTPRTFFLELEATF